ncbi:hypothetical protein GCM10011349_20370 [Novosphingobium indicum]|uniref:Rieske domain-containing protein n=1 Tax=Novosphingobium indicum TaxID=462949 RepID=A0ABQ2JK78_9SPHN|nr:hypothetical protein [Novosphingobium indicum]GGN49586.1 hypothetical protein GCM10011349_20370 [Novosphingobium indicum]
MSVPLLSDLRVPPVPGQFYMVPVVPYIYCGVKGDWPVIGPMHTDLEHFNFPDAHYHVDPRFLTEQQARRVERYGGTFYGSLAAVTQAQPLFRRGEPHEKGRPILKLRKCRSADTPYVHGGKPVIQALRADYPNPAEPIRRTDGRLLCPHRKADLSSLVPDDQGIVTCPLHGLHVDCRRPA